MFFFPFSNTYMGFGHYRSLLYIYSRQISETRHTQEVGFSLCSHQTILYVADNLPEKNVSSRQQQSELLELFWLADFVFSKDLFLWLSMEMKIRRLCLSNW
jgi:hypothetical protein